MDKKVGIQNLAMIATNNCNLNCGHCLRGCKNNKNMSKEVIAAALDQTISLGNLGISGGEITLALDVLENIFNYIIDNVIIVDNVTIAINGTNYSSDFLKLLDYMNEYINYYRQGVHVNFEISDDIYHQQELERLNMVETYKENIKKYAESKYFYGLRKLDNRFKLWREGNAESLNQNLTSNLKPMDIVITYVGKFSRFDKNGRCHMGPFVTVNPDGIITECDASIEHQQTLYNYGNVFDDTFEEVALKRGRIIKPRKWLKETGKIMKDYTYTK